MKENKLNVPSYTNIVKALPITDDMLDQLDTNRKKRQHLTSYSNVESLIKGEKELIKKYRGKPTEPNWMKNFFLILDKQQAKVTSSSSQDQPKKKKKKKKKDKGREKNVEKKKKKSKKLSKKKKKQGKKKSSKKSK